MAVSIAISAGYLLLLGLVVLRGIHKYTGPLDAMDVPLAYQNILIQTVLAYATLLWLVTTIAIAFYSWKLLIGLLIGGIITARWIWCPITERIVVYPLVARYLDRQG